MPEQVLLACKCLQRKASSLLKEPGSSAYVCKTTSEQTTTLLEQRPLDRPDQSGDQVFGHNAQCCIKQKTNTEHQYKDQDINGEARWWTGDNSGTLLSLNQP